MSKTNLLKTVNALLFVSFVVQVMTAAAFFIPKMNTLGWLYDMHKYNGFVLVALITIHLSLNWGWVKSQLSAKR